MNERMSERELVAVIDEAERDGLTNSGTFIADQEKYLEYYQRQPFGDEVDGRSQVISTDVLDLIESDMPSLARVFLGAGDPVEFQADTPNRQSIQEARDKQTLVSHILKTVPDSFRVQHAWLKSALLYDIAVLEYGVEECTTPRFKRYKGLNAEELAQLKTDLENEKDVEKVEIAEQDEESGDILLRITYTKNQYFIRNIKVDDLIISRNAESKNTADVVGKRFTKTRSDLIKEGWSHDLVASLPSANSKSEDNTLDQNRYKQQGGSDYDDSKEWANQEVRGEDVYILVDYDGDGIAERRHVIKVGDVILENEPFDHVPYAITSSLLMPNSLVGLSRSQFMLQYQRVNSVLWRQSLDNVYAVNNPRTAYTDEVDIDDLLDIRLNGVVHVEGQPQANIMTLETPYTADKTLQLVQYMEGRKTSTAGNMMANQALEADDLHKETATRFEGMQEASKAKIELVARVIAETGYRDLYEGLAWFATHFQDEDLEFRVLGREMVFNPADWRYDHSVVAKVGTGAGDTEKSLQNLTGIYQLQLAQIQSGSMLSDSAKLYNTLAEIVRQSGRYNVEEFFNDPQKPEQMLQAENDMNKQLIQQMQAQLQQQNMLAEAENVKGQYQMQMEQMKQKFNAQLEMLKMEQKSAEETAKLQEKFNSEMAELKFKYDQLLMNTKFDYTKLEVENSTDVEGEGQGE